MARKPEKLTISGETCDKLLDAMLHAILERDKDIICGTKDGALTRALRGALDGDRERVLVEVADVLSPRVTITTEQPGD